MLVLLLVVILILVVIWHLPIPEWVRVVLAALVLLVALGSADIDV